MRALSFMRIAIGLVLLADLIIRATALREHYTSDGVLPVDLLLKFDEKPLRWSFHFLNDSYAYELFLFLFNAFIAILLIVGWKTKLTTLLAWVFLVSLQNRNPFIQQSGDDFLRLILFWGIFLPWGSFYSYDAKKTIPQSKNYFSISSVGYMVLVASVYVFSALHKTSPEWRTEGTAIYYALSLDQLKVGIGDWLYQYPSLMKLLTFFVYYYLEIIAPLLILVPYKNQNLRAIAAISIILLHAGIASTLYVGLFFVIGLSTSLGLLSSGIMDKLDEKITHISKVTSSGFYSFRSPKPIRQFTFSFLLVVFLFCFASNLGNLPNFKFVPDDRFMYLNNALKLDQFWGMFSPGVYKTDGWYVYRGIKSNDSIWDIYNNKPGLDLTKPKDIDKMYPTDRWRKFAENYQKNDFNFMRPYYCRYLIREWNKKHPDNKIEGLNILFILEESLPDYKTKPIKQQNTCLCYENEPVQ